jgi:hypothetical protein
MEPAYTLRELKKIARAAIRFETAIEALVPAARRGNKYAKSNWLDNPSFGHKNISRLEFIAKIGQISDVEELVECMGERFNRNYSWNFESLMDTHKHTIEFRKPPVSHAPKGHHALSWAELTISFVQASIKCEPPERLMQIPATTDGLRWFLDQGKVAGINEPWRLDGLFENMAPLTAKPAQAQPETSAGPSEAQKRKEKLDKMANEDLTDALTFASGKEPPYWK